MSSPSTKQNQSSTPAPAPEPAPEPKPLPKTAVELERERMVALVNSIPADAKVFVLIPWEGNERHAVLSQIENGVNQYFEVPPHVHHEIRVGRLPVGAVLLVAHRVVSRARRDDGTFGPVNKLHVGGPVELAKYTATSGDGYSYTVDIKDVAAAATKACRHENGTVWLAQLSGDPLPEQKVLKLSAT